MIARVLRHDFRLECLDQVVLAQAHQAEATLAETRRCDGSTGALVAHHRITSRGRTSNGPWLLRQSRSHQPGRAVQALSLRLGGRHRRHEEPTFRTTPGSTRQRRELDTSSGKGHPPTREARRARPARRDQLCLRCGRERLVRGNATVKMEGEAGIPAWPTRRKPLLQSLKHLSQTGVRRKRREESGVRTTVSRSKRVRLIFGDRRSCSSRPWGKRPLHRMLWSFLLDTPIGRGVGWRGRIRTFDLLIQSQAPDSGLASQRLSVKDSDLCPIPG